LMSEELQQGHVRTFADVSHPTKQRMLEIYQVLQEALPGDNAAPQYQQIIGLSNSRQLSLEVREILRQLTQFAKLEQARAIKMGEAGQKLSGDDLTARYVREAAAVAADLSSPDAAKAFLLALGIFIDDSNTLRSFPATSALVTQMETDEQRRNRLTMLGEPTLRSRRDLAKHFFVSSHLLVVMGGNAARTVGLLKETLDANGGTGFSFADMAANRSGIVFGEKVLSGGITLEQIARSFTVDKFMPDVTDLAEGLQPAQLRSRFGASGETNLTAELERIEQRILDLPVYHEQARR
jgi:hypothetical protein